MYVSVAFISDSAVNVTCIEIWTRFNNRYNVTLIRTHNTIKKKKMFFKMKGISRVDRNLKCAYFII